MLSPPKAPPSKERGVPSATEAVPLLGFACVALLGRVRHGLREVPRGPLVGFIGRCGGKVKKKRLGLGQNLDTPFLG